MKLSNEEFYTILDNLGYSDFSFENLPPLPASSTITKPEYGNKPDFKNVGTFDIVEDPNIQAIKQETQIENTLDIGKVYSSYAINFAREGINIGAYLFESQNYLLFAILNQMREKSGAWRYQQNIRYNKYAEALDSKNGAKYYSNTDLNLNFPFSSDYWKADTTAFDFTDWVVSGNENNIILTHNGAKKFISDYLQDGLEIKFTPKYTNTDNVKITIDGVEKQIINEDKTLLASGNIISSYEHTILFDKSLDCFIVKRIIYDRNNVLVSGTDREIQLISKGGIKFIPEMLYNGFSISFITKELVANYTTLDIDGHKYSLTNDEGGAVEDNKILANRLITIYYSTLYHSFCVASHSYSKDEIYIGAIIQTPAKEDLSNNWLALDGKTHNWADYPELKEKCGGRYCDPDKGNINPICYTGGSTIYIDPEETKKIGNNVFSQITPRSVGEITNTISYSIYYNNNWYSKQDISKNKFDNGGISIYTNREPNVGDDIYDCEKETEGEEIKLLLIENIISNEISYISDEPAGRSYNNQEYWTLTNEPVEYVGGQIKDDNLILQVLDDSDKSVDPLLYKVSVVGEEAIYDSETDSIMIGDRVYTRTSSTPRQNTQFVYNDGIDYYIYSLTANIVNGTILFSKPIDKFTINTISYNGFSIGTNPVSDYYLNTQGQEYKNQIEGIRYSKNPIVGEKCYLTPIQSVIGQVENIQYALYNGLIYLIRSNSDVNIVYEFNNPQNTFYININKSLDRGAKLYNSIYPLAFGIYVDFTDTTIIFNNNVFSLNDDYFGEYISNEGSRYYAINNTNITQFYLSADNRNNSIEVSRKITNTSYLLANGTIIRRASSFDPATFTLLDMTDRVFVGKTPDNNTISTNGKAPKFTGYLPTMVANENWGNGGFCARTRERYYDDDTGDHKKECLMRDCSAGGIKRYQTWWMTITLDPTYQWSVYNGNKNMIVPNGYYMIYYVKAR